MIRMMFYDLDNFILIYKTFLNLNFYQERNEKKHRNEQENCSLIQGSLQSIYFNRYIAT